jgi:predicted transcriptional regulator of viral defense system
MGKVELAELPVVFTHAQAAAAGVSDRELYTWRDTGTVEMLTRGIFVRPHFTGDPDLTEITTRAPRATLCLSSALAHHGLTDEIPSVIDVALPRSQRPPRTSAPTSWHRFDKSTFDIGRGELTIVNDVRIGIFNPERTIIDVFRLRHLYGDDQAVQALRRYLQDAKQPSELLAMARRFPSAEPELRRTMEILL